MLCGYICIMDPLVPQMTQKVVEKSIDNIMITTRSCEILLPVALVQQPAADTTE